MADKCDTSDGNEVTADVNDVTTDINKTTDSVGDSEAAVVVEDNGGGDCVEPPKPSSPTPMAADVIHEDINDGVKDDAEDPADESLEIKSSDVANPIPSPESESSDRRCTSASNAGESEYESADDEEVTANNDQSFEDTVTEHPKPLSPSPPAPSAVTVDEKEDICVETVDSVECVTESEPKTSAQIVDKDVSNEPNSVTIEESSDSQTKDIVEENESKPNDLPNDEKIESKSSEELCEEVTQSEDIVPKDSKSDDKNTDVDKVSDNSNVKEEEVDNNSDTKEDEMNEDFADEEGGGEEIADDIDNEYEDMDESDDCSGDSENENKDNEEENEDKERQQGDGEESVDSQSVLKDKNVDQDEDKRNPQYIPKRGPFYEHDDRMGGEIMAAQEAASEVVVEEAVVKEQPTAPEDTPKKPIVIAKNEKEADMSANKPKKKIWVESQRWGHDLFKEDEQTPKSKDELVNIYGYDIRNEDNAPKARRQRKYGRGPNKYVRQWQDENAYSRGGRASPPIADQTDRTVRSDRNERNDRDRETMSRTNSMNERRERPPKERSSNERLANEKIANRERFDRKEKTERVDRKDRNERNDRIERNDRNDRIDKNERNDRSERRDRRHERPDRPMNDRNDRPHQRSNEGISNKSRNDRPLNDNNRYDFDDNNVEKRVQPFSKDDFPELPNNDLRKKTNSNQQSGPQEVWKANPRFGGHSGPGGESEEHMNNEYKTEPMKIIEAIEHNNRANYNDPNAGPNVVRTQTFENSKFSYRNSSGNYEFDDERGGGGGGGRGGRGRKPPEMEGSGRPIRKSLNTNNYPNYGHQKEPNDNYRQRNVRSDRSYHSEEPNRNTDRYYEEERDYGPQRDREPNYISETSPMQKMMIDDKSAAVMNRMNDNSEQTRPKRYSSLRQQQQQQQQRVITDNMSTITSNTQIPQTGDNRNISHQFYDTHTIQTSAYFPDQSTPRNTYHAYMSPNATESPQTHPTPYMSPPMAQQMPQQLSQPIPQQMPQQIPQQIPQQMPQQMPQQIPQQIPQQMPQQMAQQLTQRYLPQAVPQNTGGDNTRYISAAVPTSVVTASVPSPQMPQSLPQTGPPPPTNVIAGPPPGSAYIPSFPSGYPQFPPAPQPTHVPPGYPGHVPPQPAAAPHQIEMYRGPVYYDPSQQQSMRTASHPQRRPKAAIPIVPPDQSEADVSVNS